MLIVNYLRRLPKSTLIVDYQRRLFVDANSVAPNERISCSVVATVMRTEIDVGNRTGGFIRAIKNGFGLNWKPLQECGTCESSGGYCRYNSTREDAKFLYFCEDGSINAVKVCSLLLWQVFFFFFRFVIVRKYVKYLIYCYMLLDQILNQTMFNLFYIWLIRNCFIFQLGELILYLIELKYMSQ
jgi:hypothetical protein